MMFGQCKIVATTVSPHVEQDQLLHQANVLLQADVETLKRLDLDCVFESFLSKMLRYSAMSKLISSNSHLIDAMVQIKADQGEHVLLHGSGMTCVR